MSTIKYYLQHHLGICSLLTYRPSVQPYPKEMNNSNTWHVLRNGNGRRILPPRVHEGQVPEMV